MEGERTKRAGGMNVRRLLEGWMGGDFECGESGAERWVGGITRSKCLGGVDRPRQVVKTN